MRGRRKGNKSKKEVPKESGKEGKTSEASFSVTKDAQ